MTSQSSSVEFLQDSEPELTLLIWCMQSDLQPPPHIIGGAIFMKTMLRVLMVEDLEADAQLLLHELQRGGYATDYERVETRAAMENALAQKEWDIILCDYSLPSFRAEDALGVLKASGQDIPFIVISGVIDEETAVSTLRAGAHDFMLKGRLARLLPAIERELRDAETRRMHREAELSYRLLLEHLPIIVYVNRIDKLGSTTYVSPQIQTMLGYKPEEWLADPEFWQKVIHPDDRQEVIQKSILAGDLSESFDIEYRMLSRDGKVLWFRDQAVLVRDRRGFPLAWQGLKINITAHKEAEAERENLIANLAEINAEIERFTYLTFHDLRAPLVTIKGFLGMLTEDLQAGKADRVLGHIERIANAADKMDALLSGLLKLARLGRALPEMEEVDLGQVTREAIEMLHARIHSRHITVNVSDGMPIVYGDRLRLREVMENLIENAAKYSGGQANPTIEIGTAIRDEERVLFVKDNGQGIDPRYHNRIFNLFEKLDPMMEGTGIGLALVRRIIELHGGRIWVESDGAGMGSTFFFTLPEMK